MIFYEFELSVMNHQGIQEPPRSYWKKFLRFRIRDSVISKMLDISLISDSLLDIYCFYLDGCSFFIKWRQNICFGSVRMFLSFVINQSSWNWKYFVWPLWIISNIRDNFSCWRFAQWENWSLVTLGTRKGFPLSPILYSMNLFTVQFTNIEVQPPISLCKSVTWKDRLLLTRLS